MAILGIIRVMVSAYTSILVFSSLTPLTSAYICHDKQYFNAKLQECHNCTNCEDGTVVVRPCEFDRDTHCGLLSDLFRIMDHPHRHRNYEKHRKHNEEHKQENLEGHVAALEVASSEVPFSSAETLVWDWQAVALTSAVFACILFFLVITLYSLHQARQWRRLKENFEADVEELSARLSLMAATTSEKGEFLEPTGIGPITDANYLNNRCVYLEQLLSVRKDGSKTGTIPKGNVYIEENNSKS